MPAQRKSTRPARVAVDVSQLTLTYKEPETLKRFVTPQGYIVGRDKSGLSQKQQRRLAREIKRARHLALLPFTQTL